MKSIHTLFGSQLIIVILVLVGFVVIQMKKAKYFHNLFQGIKDKFKKIFS